MQDVRLAYARLLVSDRQYVEARAQFEKLLDDLPGNPDVSVAVGLLAMQLKDYDAAEKYLKQALAGQYRDEATVRMYLGQLFDERERYEEAADWYGSVGRGEQYVLRKSVVRPCWPSKASCPRRVSTSGRSR